MEDDTNERCSESDNLVVTVSSTGTVRYVEVHHTNKSKRIGERFSTLQLLFVV